MQLQIDSKLKELWPDAALLVLDYEIFVEDSSDTLKTRITSTLAELAPTLALADIAQLPAVQATRNAYKTLGKSPSSYRNAAEAMLRRVVKGQGLYQINNVVDINNLLSVTSGFSIGSYLTDQLSGEIIWKQAPLGEHYAGIGKDVLNIECLPTLYDTKGAFGNPTSDSKRAMIQPGKQHVMTVLYSFSGIRHFEKLKKDYEALLQAYTDAEITSIRVIQ